MEMIKLLTSKIAADISIDIPSEEEEKHIRIEEKDMVITPYQGD